MSSRIKHYFNEFYNPAADLVQYTLWQGFIAIVRVHWLEQFYREAGLGKYVVIMPLFGIK